MDDENIPGCKFVARMTSKKKNGEERAAAYGCLYLDAGEGSWEFAEHQIDSCLRGAKSKVQCDLAQVVLGFDIIATKEQIDSGVASALADRVLKYVDQKYYKIFARAVGVTCTDEPRPVRDLIFHFVDSMMDRLKQYVHSSEFDERYFFIKE